MRATLAFNGLNSFNIKSEIWAWSLRRSYDVDLVKVICMFNLGRIYSGLLLLNGNLNHSSKHSNVENFTIYLKTKPNVVDSKPKNL